jgi:hypothetical protein
MFKKISTGVFVSLFVLSVSAQDVNYEDHKLSYQQKPAYPQYSSYTTFDMAAVTTMDETEVNMNLPYQIKLGSLKQVASSGDFHVLAVLRRLSGKFTSESALTANIYLTAWLYDRHGNKVKAIYTDKEDYAVTFDKPMSKDERNNKDFVRQKVVEKVTENLLQEFVTAYNGAKLELPFELAGLSGVKKNPELADFSKTVKEVKFTTDAATLLQQMEPHVAYWEKASQYNNAEDDTVEVKRAAYQNLSIYYTVKGDVEKAAGYIEKYKAIDKVHKMLMGLLKIKHSENCEKLVAQMYPPAAEPADDKAPVVTLQEIKDNYRYVTLNGTITITGKKEGGTYEGQVQISKLDNAGGGGILNLDAQAAVVVIKTKDDKGNAKTITTDLSNVTAFKDDKGAEYFLQKFGTAAIGGAYYSILKPSYQHPKITVYRSIIPAGNNDYVVKKSSDGSTVKSSLFSSWKQLSEYVSDCTTLAEKMKNGSISKTEKAEKIAEQYAACQ